MVGRPQIKNYTALIAQQAWKAWRKMPPQTRHWIDIEDLVQDGILWTKMKVIPSYRPHRAKFSTYLTMCIEQYYSRMLAAHFSEKRNGCQTVSINDMTFGRHSKPVRTVSRWVDVPRFRKEAKDNFELSEIDETVTEIHAIETLKKLSSAASPILKHYIRHWLVLKGNLHFRGQRYKAAQKEMLQLSNQYGFSREDMEFLLYHESWRCGVDLHLNR